MEKSPFIPPSFAELQLDQAKVQEEKCRVRLLPEYDMHFFGNECRTGMDNPNRPTVVELFRPYSQNGRTTLRDVLVGMSDTLMRPVEWVDMGGGHGLAMRQMASGILARRAVRMTNIDLHDISLQGLQPDEYRYLEGISGSEGITTPRTKPNTIIDNIETVQLDIPADVITSVENMQYLNNPLGALCNWYNQLNNGGFMLVSTDHNWPSAISFDQERTAWRKPDDDVLPIHHLQQVLDEHQITYATRQLLSWRADDLNALVIQKQPGTALEINTEVRSVYEGWYGYKGVRYTLPDDDQPCIKVVRSSPDSCQDNS